MELAERVRVARAWTRQGWCGLLWCQFAEALSVWGEAPFYPPRTSAHDPVNDSHREMITSQ